MTRINLVLVTLLAVLTMACVPKETVKNSSRSVDPGTLLVGTSEIDSDELYLYRNAAYKIESFDTISTLVDSSTQRRVFSHNVDLEDGIYYIGSAGKELRHIIFEGEPKITLDVKSSIRETTVSSMSNDMFQTYLGKFQTLQNSIQQDYSAIRSIDNQDSIVQGVLVKEKEKLAYLDSLESYPVVKNMFSLWSYQSYLSADRDSFPSEANYIATEFFNQVDLANPVFNNIIDLKTGFTTYTNSIKNAFNDDQVVSYVNTQLDKIPSPSIAHKTAMIGTLESLLQDRNKVFAAFAIEEDLNKMYDVQPEQAELWRLHTMTNQLRVNTKGAVVPDIIEPTPQGDTIALSSLRGKVVLVDFWASWCGPCRRVNPFLKQVYAQYSPQGFEVYAVSLDKTKGAWENGIKQDGLPWINVSDIKGWQCASAQMYGVRGIPFNVLIDQEGKVIATNLKGQDLVNAIDSALK